LLRYCSTRESEVDDAKCGCKSYAILYTIELLQERVLTQYETVSDYLRDAQHPLDVFLKQHSHPFLVIVDKQAGEEEEGGSFFTKAFISLEDKNATIGGGPVLDPKAVVLQVKKNKKVPSTSPLASTVMVGRNDDNDLVISSSGVSKYHFYIAAQPFTVDKYIISDNGSTNGTFVNMKKVEPSKRVSLNSGDKITIGHAVGLRFYLAADFWESLQDN
jgi:hypothetical protein